MNWVDIVAIVLLCWFTFAAFHAGLIREVINVVGAVLGVALAGLFYMRLTQDVQLAISDEQTAQIVAFAMIFAATVLGSQLVSMFLKQAANLLMLGLFDSIGGAIFGFLKGFVIVEVLLIIAVTFPSLHLQSTIDNSTLAPFFLNTLPVLKTILPQEFKNAIAAF